MLLGCTADELAGEKEAGTQQGTERFEEMIKGSMWTDWQVRLMTKSREYNGEVKLRVNVQVGGVKSLSCSQQPRGPGVLAHGPPACSARSMISFACDSPAFPRVNRKASPKLPLRAAWTEQLPMAVTWGPSLRRTCGQLTMRRSPSCCFRGSLP